MTIPRSVLSKAVEKKIISSKQADELYGFLNSQMELSPRFTLTNVLYYLGGLIAIGAMTLFMNLAWESFGGWGLFVLSILYALLGLSLTMWFDKKNHPVPAGICAVFVIAMTPFAIYGLQKGMGWWPDDSVYQHYHYFIQWQWLYMELGTLAAGVILAWIYRYPFMMMPIAVTLWYMSMDLTSVIGGDAVGFELKSMVSMYFGLLMIFLAFWVDIRSRKSADYAFWLYLFGVIAFWGGMTCQNSDSELLKFIYFCTNLSMIFIGVMLTRKVFVIFGGIGCVIYLGYLAAQVFKDSLLFPMALSVIGFIVIYLGTLWQKNEAKITRKVQSLLPLPLRELLQSREHL